MNTDITDYKRTWFGEQTIANTEQIAKRIEHLLTGKLYTFVTTNTGMSDGNMTNVRVNQQMEKEKPISVWVKESFAGFSVGDSYGVWGASTSVNVSGKGNRLYDNPYFVFEWDSLKIIQRNGFGQVLEWHIVVNGEVTC